MSYNKTYDKNTCCFLALRHITKIYKMKHIKKYRNKLSRIEQTKLRSRARQKAKHDLSIKYKTEYNKLARYYFKKIRREYLKNCKEVIQ
jgi:hypothetical protein